jgi:Na+-translocating ferredoxin:NAD+ oxidoreductase RNF subunit RnfB
MKMSWIAPGIFFFFVNRWFSSMQPLEFLKFTPRTNCGECGYPACLAFAAAVTKGGEQPDKCPYVDMSALGDEFAATDHGQDGMEGVEKLLDENECHYCHITIDQIKQLAEKHKIYEKTLRGWTLEIDRLNSNFEYTPDNCVMACYWCNNAKTDEFTGKEFREIGKAIRKVWDERLKS